MCVVSAINTLSTNANDIHTKKHMSLMTKDVFYIGPKWLIFTHSW